MQLQPNPLFFVDDQLMVSGDCQCSVRRVLVTSVTPDRPDSGFRLKI